ncbi:MAG: hemolysin family protein [Planctomycetota bacterium]
MARPDLADWGTAPLASTPTVTDPVELGSADLGSAQAGPLGTVLFDSPIGTLASGVVVLAFAALCVALRTSLMRAVPGDVLKRVPEGPARDRLARLLTRSDVLASSANLLEIAFQVVFVALVVAFVAGEDPPTGVDVAVAIAVAAPLVLLVGEWLPTSLARSRSEGFIVRLLPAFAVAQRPVELFVHLLEALRRAILRGFGVRDSNPEARQLVEGFRAMVESEELAGPLEEHTRELLANVMEFRDVDAAEVMTPRTEIAAVPVNATLREAIAIFAESGYSRIPVYSGTVDTVIGTLAALEAAKAVAGDRLDTTSIAEVMRPPLLVPETKQITELLSEFRTRKQKMAIVVDEYGGTAGLVTLSNVVAELVGEMHDDEDEDEEAPIKRREDGSFELEATLHVSEVNEELGLNLPEEADFETLGGFVLAELGRFPAPGEGFTKDNVEFSVLEASDRRVLKVLVRRSA